MKELVLGTAQLGLNYGINNNCGKPNEREAFDILDYALNNNLKILDTAGAYGDSEQIIGKYLSNHKNAFRIATKLPKIKDEGDIEKHIEQSLNNLGISTIDYYLVHSFNDAIEHKETINILDKCKKNGMIKKIGISIYEIDELEYILENLFEDISIVQIPFNILDNRWIERGILKKCKEKGLSIFCRSIYLQGLFFADDAKINNIHLDGTKYINYIKKIAYERNVDLKKLLMDYAKIQDDIEYLLIGCETVEQLKENIEEFEKNTILSQEDVKEIVKFTYNIPNKIIDPRLWSK